MALILDYKQKPDIKSRYYEITKVELFAIVRDWRVYEPKGKNHEQEKIR